MRPNELDLHRLKTIGNCYYEAKVVPPDVEHNAPIFQDAGAAEHVLDIGQLRPSCLPDW